MGKLKDLTGQTFNDWTILSFSHMKNPGTGCSVAVWNARCSCGTEKLVLGGAVKGGHSKCCGCKGRIKAGLARRKPAGVAELKALNRGFRKPALSRGYEYALTLGEVDVLVNAPCAYCGVSHSNRKLLDRKRSREVFYNGIDRVDNSRGYVRDNVVPACFNCNYMKRDMTAAAFLEHLSKIVTHSGEKVSKAATMPVFNFDDPEVLARVEEVNSWFRDMGESN